MTTVNAVDAYDKWHSKYEVDHDTNTPWHKMVISVLRPEEDLRGRSVLEIGCGRGGFASWLATQPFAPAEIVAADFSPLAVEKGRNYSEAQGLRGIKWEVKDIQNLGEVDNRYDTIISFETIEHVPEPAKAILELARVLKPGGRLYLTTPNYFSIIGLYRFYCWMRGKTFDEGGQPICHVTRLPLTREWLKKARLGILTYDSCGQYLPFPRRPPIPLAWADRPKFIMKHFGLHSMFVCEKRK